MGPFQLEIRWFEYEKPIREPPSPGRGRAASPVPRNSHHRPISKPDASVDSSSEGWKRVQSTVFGGQSAWAIRCLLSFRLPLICLWISRGAWSSLHFPLPQTNPSSFQQLPWKSKPSLCNKVKQSLLYSFRHCSSILFPLLLSELLQSCCSISRMLLDLQLSKTFTNTLNFVSLWWFTYTFLYLNLNVSGFSLCLWILSVVSGQSDVAHISLP